MQPHKQDIDFKFSIIFLSSKIILLWFLGQLGVWPSVTVLTPSIMSSFLNMRPGVPPWSNNVQVGCYHDPFHFLLCQVESLPCQVASCWFIAERGFINLDRFSIICRRYSGIIKYHFYLYLLFCTHFKNVHICWIIR